MRLGRLHDGFVDQEKSLLLGEGRGFETPSIMARVRKLAHCSGTGVLLVVYLYQGLANLNVQRSVHLACSIRHLIMRASLVAWGLWLASPVMSRHLDHRSATARPFHKRITPRSDDTWDHIVVGADVAEQIGKSVASSSSPLADFRLRANAVDPSELGVDTVKQYSGYLDNDAEDKHLFYCKLSQIILSLEVLIC